MNLPQTITEIGDQAIGYYTPSDSKDNTAKKIDRLHVYNAGSNAVSQYIRQWKSDDYKYWIIGGAVAVVIVGGVIALISVRRYRNKIRPTSRHASERSGRNKGKGETFLNSSAQMIFDMSDVESKENNTTEETYIKI